MTVPVRRDYVDTSWGQLHIATAGSGEPVILLHQTPRSWDEYREVLPMLGRRFRAIAVDTPGMGASDVSPLGHSVVAYARAVLDMLDALGIGSCHLVGHHTGGVIAVEVAARAPERVDRLVLSSTPYVDEAARADRAGRRGIDEVEPRPDGTHLTELWQRRQRYYPQGETELLARYLRDALATEDPEEGHRAVERYRMEDRIGSIRQPTLCVGHDADPFAFPGLSRLAELIPGARTEVIAGGAIPLEHTAGEFSRVVLGFLSAGAPVRP